MNLTLALESYFGRLEDEEVAPLRYRDASSYERLRATWADSRPLPAEQVLLRHWQDVGRTRIEDSQRPRSYVTQEAFEALVTRIEALERDKGLGVQAG